MAYSALMKVMVDAVRKAGRSLSRDFGEVQNLQVAAHAWVDPSTLTEYPLPPADVNLVAKLQRRFAVP